MAPELAKKYTVVATDLRGYGDSDMPDLGDLNKETMAELRLKLEEMRGEV